MSASVDPIVNTAEVWKITKPQLRNLKMRKDVIDGFLPIGLGCFGGQPGVGKTTVLVYLSLVACNLIKPYGLSGYSFNLQAKRKRHILYVTEDVEQINNILFAYKEEYNLDPQEVENWFHIIAAQRVPSQHWQYFSNIAMDERFTNYQGSQAILPLVVIDTQSASFDLVSENDNSEVSKMLAILKENLTNLEVPVWLVGHIAKASFNRQDIMTFRGASSFEGDTNFVVFIFKEHDLDKMRYVKLAKHRFVPEQDEIAYMTNVNAYSVQDEFGDEQIIKIHTIEIMKSSEEEREKNKEEKELEIEERKEETKEQKRAQKLSAQADQFFNAFKRNHSDYKQFFLLLNGPPSSKVPDKFKAGKRISREDVKSILKIENNEKAKTLMHLISANWPVFKDTIGSEWAYLNL